ncbi:MAG: hypothetical protein HMLKMBBP_00224 [Planctomycetes bacterium]|nr:hypothetical protein [Planctomycetota bacterium]
MSRPDDAFTKLKSTAGAPSPDWPEEFRPYRWEGAEITSSDVTEDDRAGRDSLGTPGRVTERRAVAVVREKRTGALAQRLLEEAGMRVLVTEPDRTELSVPRPVLGPETEDPFLLESRLTASVRGRSFPGQQRSMIEAKCEALRRELADTALPAPRRGSVETMLRNLEDGLATQIEMRFLERRFTPELKVPQPVDEIGTVIPVRRRTRIVYRVNSIDQEKGAEGEADAMVFHVVALGAREAAVLFTGGVHGLRHIHDLVEGRSHHAWFANRETARTDATAPWIGRAVFRELRDHGTSEVVIHKRRDAGPVSIEKIGEDRSFVRVDGRPVDVPVIRCRTSREDDLVILDDADNPLVLRLVETGAELVRTIDAILTPPGHGYRLPGAERLAAV